MNPPFVKVSTVTMRRLMLSPIIRKRLHSPTRSLLHEKSGELLNQVSTVFGNLLSAETNDDMQELAKSIMPLLSEHGNNITLNEKLLHALKQYMTRKTRLILLPSKIVAGEGIQ